MTKQEIIEQHNKAVEGLCKARLYKPTDAADDEASMLVIKQIEQQVSVLGQAYNPRISRKAATALGW